MKFKMLTLLMMGLFSFSAFSLDYENHLGFGLNIDTYKADFPPNQDLKDDIKLAPTLGLKSVILWGNIGLRTGAFLEWKKVHVEDSLAPSNVDLTAYYAAIPLNLQFNLNNTWAIFGGLTPRVLLAKTCESCGSFDDDSNILVNYSNAGISYKFGDTFSMDASFNHAVADNFENLKINTSQVLLLWKI